MINSKEFQHLSTPFYYYDFQLFKDTVDILASVSKKYDIDIHYAVKANSERKLLSYMAENGFGADCVSGNEVAHCVECGISPTKIVYAGVGKTDKEINAALELGIGLFNCESIPELHIINELASARGCVAPIALRVNPNIEAHTHEYITTGLEDNKFGISDYSFDEVIETVKSLKNVEFKGLHFHIGSQITDIATIYKLECERAAEIVAYFEERGLEVDNIDLGGGLGIDYEDPDRNPIPDFELWLGTIAQNFPRRPGQRIHVEPGRAIVGQCASLISRVLYVKPTRRKTFLIVDAGMNDLIRPALYGAFHKIEVIGREKHPLRTYDVVGPICESSDVWAKDFEMPEAQRGDFVAIRSAGAYGSTMSSRYNMRDLAPAVFSDEL